nr:amidase family protein [Ruania alba]
MADLHDLTARELAAAIRSGTTSPAEVLAHTEARMEELGERIGAFVTAAPELARTEADDAARLLADHDAETLAAEHPLLGVPLPIKDLTMVAGVPMRAGSAAMDGFVPPADDGIVTRFREAGSVMVGKTNTPRSGCPATPNPRSHPRPAPPGT